MITATQTVYQPSRGFRAKFRRRIARLSNAKPLLAEPLQTRICFTFDDFPKSSVDNGASILDAVGGKGCYYACTGIAETHNHLGDMFDADDLLELARTGHEIGAHTETHINCAEAADETVLKDVDTNLARIREMGHTDPVRQFAWPYGETRSDLKPKLASRFDAVRGIYAGINNRGADLMQLKAMELDESDASIERAAAAIEAASRQPTWLFIFTHDVREKHSAWGTTPAHLRRLVRLARDTGAKLQTPSMALDAITVKYEG